MTEDIASDVSFLIDEELIEVNPMKQVKDVNEPQEQIDVLTR